ncbi:MAG TPA: hypothetical protein VKQ32_05235 [Polyangia bacterium]|nr:hypothetical protein [Polyangia bacterium]
MTRPVSTSDPERLLDESGTSSLERALLGAGASYKSSPHARAKVIAGLGLAGSASLIGGSAVASSVSSVAKVTWTKVLLGLSLFGATAVPVGYYALRRQEAPAQPEHVAGPASIAAGSGSAAAAPVTPEDMAPDSRAAMLKDELGAIDHARVALASGDARRALEDLDAYDRRFPGGRLQIEAEVMRIDAFAKLGRKDIARQRAEVFLKRHPNSVLATRVRAHIAD